MRRDEQPPRSRAAECHGLHLQEQLQRLLQEASATSHPWGGSCWSAEHGGSPGCSRCPVWDPALHQGQGQLEGIQEGARRMRRSPRTWPIRKGEGKNFWSPQKLAERKHGNGLLLRVGCCMSRNQEISLDGSKEISYFQLFWSQIAPFWWQNLSRWGLKTALDEGDLWGFPAPGAAPAVSPRASGPRPRPGCGCLQGWRPPHCPRLAPSTSRVRPRCPVGTSHPLSSRKGGRHRPPLRDTDWLSFTSTTPDWLRPLQAPGVPQLQEAVGAPGPAC